jgi:hypothetical protein
MAATAPLAAAVATMSRKNRQEVMSPSEACTRMSRSPATYTSTNPMRKLKNIMSVWGQARRQMVRHGASSGNMYAAELMVFPSGNRSY